MFVTGLRRRRRPCVVPTKGGTIIQTIRKFPTTHTANRKAKQRYIPVGPYINIGAARGRTDAVMWVGVRFDLATVLQNLPRIFKLFCTRHPKRDIETNPPINNANERTIMMMLRWATRSATRHHRRCFSTAPSSQETFLTGTTSVYAEQLYEVYQQDPTAVHASWRRYFDNLEQSTPYAAEDFAQPTAVTSSSSSNTTSTTATAAASSDSLGVAHLIRAYQVNGHLAAQLDPLETFSPASFPYRPTETPPELTPAYHGFDEAELDRPLQLLGKSSGGNTGYLHELSTNPHNVTLRQVMSELQKTYTQTLGVEYMVCT